MMREGSWWLRSETDPRWKKNGRTTAAGGFVMPTECEAALTLLKLQYGEPPADLEWGYMKH